MPPCRSELVQSSMLAAKPYAIPEPAFRRQASIVVQDQAGFPTYSQYKAIETCYLESLNSKRRSKALISQDLFDRIQNVLMRPQEGSESAQFRYWVRKMFQFGRSSDYGQGVQVPRDSDMVLMHDGALVAVQERLYPLLCYFHGISHHAGRDKTYVLIRQHYSWVPKDLVAQFIRFCPTCKSKGRGRIQSLPCSPTVPHLDSGTLSEPSSPTVSFVEPLDSYQPIAATPPHLQSPAPTSTRSAKVTGLGLHTLPMSREVSLYRGLPNGWQFHSDYATAREACVEMKKLQGGHHQTITGRPRIPSIAPLIPTRSMQELINTYLPECYDSPANCVNPALISSPLSDRQDYDESYSFSHDRKQDLVNDDEPPRLFYTLRNVDISELDLQSSRSGSPDYAVPDLASPTVTELPTPQDESVMELAGSKGFKFSPSQNADTQF
ncbi:hypothetical protein JOM56_011342 [Amanita muscaria]